MTVDWLERWLTKEAAEKVARSLALAESNELAQRIVCAALDALLRQIVPLGLAKRDLVEAAQRLENHPPIRSLLAARAVSRELRVWQTEAATTEHPLPFAFGSAVRAIENVEAASDHGFFDVANDGTALFGPSGPFDMAMKRTIAAGVAEDEVVRRLSKAILEVLAPSSAGSN